MNADRVACANPVFQNLAAVGGAEEPVGRKRKIDVSFVPEIFVLFEMHQSSIRITEMQYRTRILQRYAECNVLYIGAGGRPAAVRHGYRFDQ